MYVILIFPTAKYKTEAKEIKAKTTSKAKATSHKGSLFGIVEKLVIDETTNQETPLMKNLKKYLQLPDLAFQPAHTEQKEETIKEQGKGSTVKSITKTVEVQVPPTFKCTQKKKLESNSVTPAQRTARRSFFNLIKNGHQEEFSEAVAEFVGLAAIVASYKATGDSEEAELWRTQDTTAKKQYYSSNADDVNLRPEWLTHRNTEDVRKDPFKFSVLHYTKNPDLAALEYKNPADKTTYPKSQEELDAKKRTSPAAFVSVMRTTKDVFIEAKKKDKESLSAEHTSKKKAFQLEQQQKQAHVMRFALATQIIKDLDKKTLYTKSNELGGSSDVITPDVDFEKLVKELKKEMKVKPSIIESMDGGNDGLRKNLEKLVFEGEAARRGEELESDSLSDESDTGETEAGVTGIYNICSRFQ